MPLREVQNPLGDDLEEAGADDAVNDHEQAGKEEYRRPFHPVQYLVHVRPGQDQQEGRSGQGDGRGSDRDNVVKDEEDDHQAE